MSDESPIESLARRALESKRPKPKKKDGVVRYTVSDTTIGSAIQNVGRK